MFEKVLEKILKKFKFVQDIRTDRDIFCMQYKTEKQYNENLLECCRKQQAEIEAMKADKDRMERILVCTISNMHMIFGIGEGRHINITGKELQEAVDMQIVTRENFAMDGIGIYCRKKKCRVAPVQPE